MINQLYQDYINIAKYRRAWKSPEEIRIGKTEKMRRERERKKERKREKVRESTRDWYRHFKIATLDVHCHLFPPPSTSAKVRTYFRREKIEEGRRSWDRGDGR